MRGCPGTGSQPLHLPPLWHRWKGSRFYLQFITRPAPKGAAAEPEAEAELSEGEGEEGEEGDVGQVVPGEPLY